MSLFCIIGHDAAGSAKKRELHLNEHLECLRVLKQEGRLFAAGPLMNSTDNDAVACGSLLIIEFKSLIDARAWFENEVYYRSGVYDTFQIKPYLDIISVKLMEEWVCYLLMLSRC